MNLFYLPDISNDVNFLDPEESRHCIKVLRKQPGDKLDITDGKGFFYQVQITEANPHRCTFEIQQRIKEPEKNFFIHIAISPTKNADRIEWFIEKSVEIGINKITIIQCHRTERNNIKPERLKKVAISALKQSLKATLPSLIDVVPFNHFLHHEPSENKFIAFVDMENKLHLKTIAPPRSSYCVLIGPEGDFTPAELKEAADHGFKKVSLGSSRLRTETAGVTACHILNLINE